MDNKNKQSNINNSTNASNQVDKQGEVPELGTGPTIAHSSAWRRLLAKKWAYPALYIAAVAIILCIMWAYQGVGKTPLIENDPSLTLTDPSLNGENGFGDDSLPVTAALEDMHWPVADFNQMEVLVPFFDSEGTNEAQQAATIQYGNTFRASLGMSLARQDNEPFDVLAALSGTVSRVSNHPLAGHQVEITHEDGFKTVYQSLSDVTVTLNEEVDQGDVIAQAGRNELGKHLGVHLHFEVYQDGQPMNPDTLINGM